MTTLIYHTHLIQRKGKSEVSELKLGLFSGRIFEIFTAPLLAEKCYFRYPDDNQLGLVNFEQVLSRFLYVLSLT